MFFQINFVMLNPNPCGSNFTTPGGQALLSMSSASGGNVFLLEPTQVSNFTKYMSNQYQSALVMSYGQSQPCVSTTPIYVPVDSHTTTLTVTVTGFMPTVKIQDPTGTLFYTRSNLI